ncbi:MAG: hypothetical protein IJS31_05625 [Oscillospiraceae bacterium]|nr:hypothetical protein [Oscillospiraceae bacterium]
MAKQNPKQMHKKEDTVVYRAIADLAIVIVSLLILPLIRSQYANADLFEAWRNAFLWITICGAVLAVAAAVIAAAVKSVRKIGVIAACGLAVIAIASLALYLFAYPVIPYLYYFVIAGGALYLIYLLYPVDFVAIATLMTLAGGVFYLHGAAGMLTRSSIVLYAILVLLIAADVYFASRAVKHSGRVHMGKKSFRFYARKGGALPTYAAAAVLIACIAAAILFGSVFAGYCVYGVAAVLFIFACYYTFQLD